jgi:hypothetical protein
MRRILFVVVSLAVAGNLLVFGTPAPVTTAIAGDYVEARTASVFAGACHYNGELGTTGRDAVMAWSLASGKWKGTDLSGVRVVAAVSSDVNLGDAAAARQSEIVVDSAATADQAAAAIDMLQTKFSGSLGRVVKVLRAPVSFRHEARVYSVEAEGFASLSVEAMPNDLCCLQPNLVWYSPFVPLGQRKVGYTRKAAFKGGPIGESWERARENSAFYGSIAL